MIQIQSSNTISTKFLDKELGGISLYFHIPFCEQKCFYCDFYSKSTVNGIDLFIDNLIKEIELFVKALSLPTKINVKTIFFGGGTPSIISPSQWKRLTEVIHKKFDLSQLKEWTIESNPESFTEDKATTWLESGVNRVSFGVQSLDDEVLKKSGRVHTAKRVYEVVESGLLQRFRSVNFDIIYGLPNQTIDNVTSTIEKLMSFNIADHISAYELTIAPNTPFAKYTREKFPQDEEISLFEKEVKELLIANEFFPYEVSNFAKIGRESIHNSNYWNQKIYFGFGPSAHSFDGINRYSNVISLEKYNELISNNTLPIDSFETLSKNECAEEFLFLGLRTINGISIQKYRDYFGEDLLQGERKAVIENLVKSGKATIGDTTFSLTYDGLSLADGVALKLLP